LFENAWDRTKWLSCECLRVPTAQPFYTYYLPYVAERTLLGCSKYLANCDCRCSLRHETRRI